jgi:phytoene synthase
MARDTNFYYSFLALPRHKRQALVAVWDFCRAVDDTIDERAMRGPAGQSDARRAMAAWRRELEACYGGASPATEVGRSLQPHLSRFALPKPAFEAIIDGVEMDVDPGRRYATFADLREYCQRVASAVGLLSIEIFGYRNGGTRTYATELGLALQLTNIVRDVAVDLAKGRMYLPVDELVRFGCTEDMLRRGVVTEPVACLLAYQCARARECYRRARLALPREDARRLVAAEIMSRIYQAILAKIERRHYDVFSRPVVIPRPQRAAIACVTWARIMADVRT